jgi:hypothetical protein
MLARAIEYQRPAAAEQQRAALLSDLHGAEGAARTLKKTESVTAPEKNERTGLQPDAEGGGAYYFGSSAGDESGTGDGSDLMELSELSDEGRFIDITV